MSLSNQTVRVLYQGNNSTTVFAIPFDTVTNYDPDFAYPEVKVWIREEADPDNIVETLQTEGSTYETDETNVTFNDPPTSTQKILIIRGNDKTQLLDYDNQGPFPAESHESALDKLTALVQELMEKVNRSPLFDITSNYSNIAMDDPVAENVLVMNQALDRFQMLSKAQFLGLDITLDGGGSGTIVDNQVSATDITDWVIDGATYSSAVYYVEIQRGASIFTNKEVHMRYRSGAWEIDELISSDDVDGVTLSVDQTGSVGQVQYVSTSEGTAGTIKWRRVVFYA